MKKDNKEIYKLLLRPKDADEKGEPLKSLLQLLPCKSWLSREFKKRKDILKYQLWVKCNISYG